jgi:hypothetical protein
MMILRFLARLCLITLTIGLSSSAFGGTIWNEADNGDLSNSGLAPTAVGPLTVGSNEIFGSTGSSASGVVDLDYFVITVPTGFVVNSLNVLPGTQAGGSVSFIGVEAGPQVTVSPDATSAAGLLGWTHYGPANINMDILPAMSIASEGSSGFTPPLGAGQYSFWIQELSVGAFQYGFDLELAAASSVPEPGTLSLMVVGLAVGFPLLARRRVAA